MNNEIRNFINDFNEGIDAGCLKDSFCYYNRGETMSKKVKVILDTNFGPIPGEIEIDRELEKTFKHIEDSWKKIGIECNEIHLQKHII